MNTRTSAQFSREAVRAAEHYNMGILVAESRMAGGTLSNARRLDTDRGSYILRQLSGIVQARREYWISEALRGHEVCPEILETLSGEGWFEDGDIFYNVQRLIEPMSTEGIVMDHTELGSLAGKLHAGLYGETLDEQPDRFDLEGKWRSFLEAQTVNDRCGLLIQRLEEQVLECLALNKRFEERIYIHGDLGNWNLIFGRAGVRIIDFGEARLGSRHFDLAALLTSTTDAEDRQASRYLSAYLEGYTRHADGFKASVLAEQIRLWNVRGAVALLESIGVNERSVRYAERVLKQSEVWAKRLC